MSVNVPTLYAAPRVLDVSPSEPILSPTWSVHAERLHHLYSRSGPRIPLVWQDDITTTSGTFERVGSLSGVTGVWRTTRVLAGDVYRLTVHVYGANIEVQATTTDTRDGVGGVLDVSAVTLSALGEWGEITIELTAAASLYSGVPVPLALDLEVRTTGASGVLIHAHAVCTVFTDGADVPTAAAAGLDPSTLPSILLASDARDISQANASIVSTWPRSAGSNPDLFANAGREPTLYTSAIGSAAGVYFDGVNDFMVWQPTTTDGNYTVAWWASGRTAGNPDTIISQFWDAGSPRTFSSIVHNGFDPQGAIRTDGFTQASGAVLKDDAIHLFALVCDRDATTATLYRDGVALQSDVGYFGAALNTSNPSAVGAWFNGLINYGEMILGAFWLFDEALDLATLNDIQSWCEGQWGVTAGDAIPTP